MTDRKNFAKGGKTVIEQRYSPRRSRATRKPSVTCPETVFYRCPKCGQVIQQLDRPREGGTLICCGTAMERLEPKQLAELPAGMRLDHRIVGGYNDNAVEFIWDGPCQLEWVFLRTFTGGCIKYPPPKKRPPIIFSLADEDAYAYCDESPCLECVFRCKRGFILYAYLSGVGLVELPIDRMDPYWQTAAKNDQTGGIT